jgi:hypothetical protein
MTSAGGLSAPVLTAASFLVWMKRLSPSTKLMVSMVSDRTVPSARRSMVRVTGPYEAAAS